MKKMNSSLAKLTSQLLEGIVKSQPSTHMAEKSSSFKPIMKGKGQKGKKKPSRRSIRFLQEGWAKERKWQVRSPKKNVSTAGQMDTGRETAQTSCPRRRTHVR